MYQPANKQKGMHKLYAKKHQQKEMHMLHTYKGNLLSEKSTKRQAQVTCNPQKCCRHAQVVCRVKNQQKDMDAAKYRTKRPGKRCSKM